MLLRAGLRGTFLLCRPFVKGWVTELSHCDTNRAKRLRAKDANEQKKIEKNKNICSRIFFVNNI